MNHPPYFKRALPHTGNFVGYTKIYFAENQLSLSLISLSPLTIGHPNLFQQTRVQSSNIYFYIIFNLPMVRSLSFGSYIYDLKPFKNTYLIYLRILYKY